MAFGDTKLNFRRSAIVSPPAGGTIVNGSLTVTPGDGLAQFGGPSTPPFWVTIQPASGAPTLFNSVRARVTAISGDSLTVSITSPPRVIIAGDLISMAQGAEDWQAVEGAVTANTTAIASEASTARANEGTNATAIAGKVASVTAADASVVIGGTATNPTVRATASAPADATTGAKGIVQLAGDLAGTAALPTVPGLAGKVGTGDSRLSDARTPLGHHASHAPGGSDPLVLTDLPASVASMSGLPASAGQVPLSNGTGSNLATWGAPPSGGVALVPNATPVTASGTLTAGRQSTHDCTSGAQAQALPAGLGAGIAIAVAKDDATANALTVTGNIRGVGASSIVLAGAHELVGFITDAAGSWWPSWGHKTKAYLDALYLPISQKGAVNGLATLDPGGHVPAGQIPVVRPVPATGARSFLPNGVKLRMANLTVKPSYPLTNSGFAGQGAWAQYYLDWDWAGWIKPQIDDAIQEGCNGIRQIGDVFGLFLGYYTEATYLAQWAQLINYCAANNLYVYATGGSELHFGGQSYAQAAAYIAAYASFVNQFPNVIALDVLQEIPDTTSARIANLATVRNAAKAANPNLPMTFSMASVNNYGTASIVQALDPVVDYFDGHVYSTQVEAVLNFVPGSGYATAVNPKPLMIGEFGASQGQTSAQRVAHAKSVRDFLARHPSVIGCGYWTMRDQDAAGTASNNYGLYTNARTALNNGGPLTLPAATINVVSTAGAGTQTSPAFPASGTFQLGGQTITYTGTTATTFTGCTGGVGAIPDGSPIGVRRSDVADVLRTFPERVAPLTIEYVQATDTAISATIATNNIQVTKDLRFPVPMLVKMTATADIDIQTAGNVYSVQASVPGAQTLDGTALVVPKAVGGGQIQRITLTSTYEALLPAGYNSGNFTFAIGHVSGTASTDLAKATNTRCVWTLTPL
jgi:hypothetical protein